MKNEICEYSPLVLAAAEKFKALMQAQLERAEDIKKVRNSRITILWTSLL